MGTLSDLKMYARFAWGLRGFLRHTVTLEEAKAVVRQRLAEREANFLRLMKKGIFGYPRSPYLPLLKLAQVELRDIETMVSSKGLEATLLALREAGVYVTFEEFKGREAMVRDGHVMPVRAHDFDNPYLKHYYYGRSGGTTGAGTRIPTDLDHLTDRAPNIALALDAHSALLGVPVGIWFGVFPDDTGINETLTHIAFGQGPQKWFAPVVSKDLRPSFKYLVGTRLAVEMVRLHGVSVPAPQLLRLDEAAVVARWVERTLEVHGTCLLRTLVSLALRVCIAAYEEGLDLTGAYIMAGGEPPTPAKVQAIERTGARYIPNYFFSEAGAVGMGCACPADENDNHFFNDSFALIQHSRRVPGWQIKVDAFHFTSLLPTAPKLLLNVESDDYGTIESRACGCALESCGFTEHLRLIRSFRKLTGEGVTLVGGEMLRVLEEVLPARFGGSPLDYQLLEEEDEEGFTRLSLLVSPEVDGADDEGEVVEAVLEALGQGSVSADLARAVWAQAGSLRVRRRKPVWTARGKLMPLHLARNSERASEASMDS